MSSGDGPAEGTGARSAVGRGPNETTTVVLSPSSLAAVSGTKISHAMPGDVVVQLTIPQSSVCRHFPPFSPKSIIEKTSHIVVPPFLGSPSPRAGRPHMLGHSLEFLVGACLSWCTRKNTKEARTVSESVFSGLDFA